LIDPLRAACFGKNSLGRELERILTSRVKVDLSRTWTKMTTGKDYDIVDGAGDPVKRPNYQGWLPPSRQKSLDDWYGKATLIGMTTDKLTFLSHHREGGTKTDKTNRWASSQSYGLHEYPHIATKLIRAEWAKVESSKCKPVKEYLERAEIEKEWETRIHSGA
jgi:hypothetical protein